MVETFYSSPGNQLFYSWTDVAENWIVDENKFDQDFPSVPQEAGTSLASHIIQNIFSLPLGSDENIGSYMPGYDVKNRDAYQMIQLSLAAELTGQKLYECYADNEGKVKFYHINSNDDGADIDGDELYKINSEELRQQQCDTVMVIGYDPPPKKIVRGPYNLFTFAVDYTGQNINPDDPFYDEELRTANYPRYWVIGDILGPEACDNYREGYIEFGNPALSDEEALTDEIFYHDEFEKIIGWLYSIEVPWYIQGSTQVELQNRSPRYETLDTFGKLQQRSWVSSEEYKPQLCLTQEDVDDDTGVELPNSDNKKFLGVREVYIYGYELTSIDVDEVAELTEGGGISIRKGTRDFIVTANTMLLEPIRLSQGQDYVVVKQPNGKYRIVFSCNVSPNYIDKFGYSIANEQSSFRFSPSSVYVDRALNSDPLELKNDTLSFFDSELISGYLKDGKSPVTTNTTYTAAIFPMGEGTSGYAIPSNGKIVVVYDWDNPCIRFLDQEQQVTQENLDQVSVELYAVITKDLPPPIAYSQGGGGNMLDPREIIPDLNAATVDLITTSTYQQVMESLENGDVKIVLPFIGCDGDPWEECSELISAAEFIYGLQNQKVETTTYTFDPDAEPVLGAKIGNKVINSIDYSYQDSSQYFITVQAGPVWQGMGGWDSSVYQNKTERVQLEGIVRWVSQDNLNCTVQLERLGLMDCVNGQLDKLEKGDTVKVTVYNNPISV